MKKDPNLGYTHDCVRTLAFTTPCTADGFTDSRTLLEMLHARLEDVELHGEIQEACGHDAKDLRELEPWEKDPL